MVHPRPYSFITEADNDPPQEMGDATKTELSEADSDAFDAKRSEAMSALGEGEWQKGPLTYDVCINFGLLTPSQLSMPLSIHLSLTAIVCV